MNSMRILESARLFAGFGTPTRLRDGRSTTIRLATPGDAGLITAMHARCSPETIYQRYHSMPPLTGRFLVQLLNTDVALVAEAANGNVVATANLGRDADGTGEVAVLVEDVWQHAGLGTRLLGHVVTMARLVGFAEVYAVSLPGAAWPERAFGRLGRPRVERTPGQVWMRLALSQDAARPPVPVQLPAA